MSKSNLVDKLGVNDTYELKNVGRYSKEPKQPITVTESYRNQYVTHTGHPLSFREARFIDAYMVDGDKKHAVEVAGFKVKNLSGKAYSLLNKDYIADEIAYRSEIYKSQFIANREEVMEYLTSAMRGEIKDQFDLDPTLADRTAAARELAKILIYDVDKAKNVNAQQVVVNIDFNRDDSEPTEVVDIQQLSD